MALSSGPSSLTATQDDVTARLSRLQIGNPTPGGLPKAPTRRVQAESNLHNKPLPAPPVWAQKPPPLPPRPHRLWDRPNPYEDNVPLPRPPPIIGAPVAMPDPTRRGARPPHTHFVPPVSITYHQSDSRYQILPTTPTPSGFSAPGPPQAPVSPPSTSRSRASSVPPSPSATKVSSHVNDGRVQCSGKTRAGTRCKRMIKPPHPLMLATGPSKDLDCFCFQHIKDLLSPSGFPMPGGVWIDFDDWIPHYLTSDTRAALRVEMEKRPSPADEPGYIYGFEPRDRTSKHQNTLSFKIGRSIHMIKRLDQWGRQCASQEVVLRGQWPRVVNDDGTEPSLLKGRIKQGEKGKFCHRWERLIHLELADLMVHEQYLTLDFFVPNSKASPSLPSPTRPEKPSAARKPIRSECPDCGAVHREIFTFTRVESGPLKGREWEGIVQKVIDRWGKFVETYV
ncbi:hypothetical protein BS47DRAFT_1335163 [Hydnum rufescens UP504]|uniref:Uncharacterized protein n=1 Tax=Hydnum rufescens UP504 TaxID=1448309 RepID=A0A9P6BCA9_9AGAM|nr:hypothetical protein BS47DRAFT_1335163 [Hydnum rufescens UP504]